MEKLQAAYNRRKRRYSSFFKDRPPVEAIQIPGGPPRPDVFDEVKLGPYVSETDAKIAYQVWSLPDEVLGREWRARADRPFPAPETETGEERETHALGRNVYEHLMLDPLIPLSRADAEKTKSKALKQGEYWNTVEMIRPWRDDIIRESPIHTVAFWTAESIRLELKERGLRPTGSRDILEDCLIEDEIKRHCGIMPRSDLSHWAIERPEKYALQPATTKKMSALDMYTFAVHLSPYNPAYWVSRAYCHYQQAYFDLALGDAWRAKLLCDVLLSIKERSRQPGLYTRVWHAIEQHLLAVPQYSAPPNQGQFKPEIFLMRELGAAQFIPTLLQAIDNIMDLSMIALSCWKDYSSEDLQYRSKLVTSHRDAMVPAIRKDVVADVEDVYCDHMEHQKLFWYEKLHGWSPADRSYPYETHDVQRADQTFLDTLNLNLFHLDAHDPNAVPAKVREACFARDSHGLGVFATDDIKKGDVIYYEEPTIRGNLPPRRMKLDNSKPLDEWRCENCQMIVHTELLINGDVCACAEHWTHRPNTPGLVFCPTVGSRSCLNIAREVHHFGTCGKNWSWLYDSMRPNIMDYNGIEHLAHSNETQGTGLSLLLRNVFEITLERRRDSPDLGPHEINELLVLEGDGQRWKDSWFPFSMAGNITVPFDILTLLGVDIFRDLSFDTWVIQIVLRKLLTNVIPWDKQRRGRVPDIQFADHNKAPEHPDDQDRRIKKRLPFRDWDPSFMNLYLFPGLSMFNHSCRKAHNAEWGYDTTIPNRVAVWATRSILKGEEIRLRYRYGKVRSQDRATRLFGGECLCPECQAHPPPEYDPHPQEIDGAYETDGTVHTDIPAPSESEDEGEEKQKTEENEDTKGTKKAKVDGGATLVAGKSAVENDGGSNSARYRSLPRKVVPRSVDLIPVGMGEKVRHNGRTWKARRRENKVPKTWFITLNQQILKKIEKEARKPGQTRKEFKAEVELVRQRWWKEHQENQRKKAAMAAAQEMGIID
ncbi:uncharacterized protein N7459_006894 [Penicillium hispanicum]|uniref:uncharacterized protein n=1 Tax=Penicillium hispanicum TaxID=1080232 RepID=UPI00254253AC|nr:uncharacterized protein N7459_006894 [Penicillium hispanicum]KAJ5577930.1 hypothetical protein N7459_006894 [Penicillium hispanicum]